jgi:hypothetical protein
MNSFFFFFTISIEMLIYFATVMDLNTFIFQILRTAIKLLLIGNIDAIGSRACKIPTGSKIVYDSSKR